MDEWNEIIKIKKSKWEKYFPLNDYDDDDDGPCEQRINDKIHFGLIYIFVFQRNI